MRILFDKTFDDLCELFDNKKQLEFWKVNTKEAFYSLRQLIKTQEYILLYKKPFSMRDVAFNYFINYGLIKQVSETPEFDSGGRNVYSYVTIELTFKGLWEWYKMVNLV